ncbi:LPS assembly protein LptD [Vibrio quintilis]|uniref:LPS-assembly protein LptD n=1 Tax=Vibrio quintilis TaxID=1117707 RepID=A0A1M7YSN8_9VIBR|nr:LPS assembly protein LptD [Vibrio quintilis]SHO55630.1 LPS-assembly protein LptD precursor [Vibrio quintilis]
MSDFPRSLLAASISAALFIPYSYADSIPEKNKSQPLVTEQCHVDSSAAPDNLNQPINVEADKLEAINGDKATYSGNVVVTQGNKRMSAEKVTLHQKENVVVAQGNVNFTDGELQTVSDKATNNLSTDEVTLENTHYQFLCKPGRGDAVYVARTGKALYKIEDGSITSCPENDNSWQLKASSIYIDQNEEEATFYNPRMEIQGVPFFYLPVLTVPIGDTRKTGFLYPTFSFGSQNGFELTLPVYWNLAPNYDLQTDFKHMEKRGTQLNSRFRYLTDWGSGAIDYEYMPEDKQNLEEGERWGLNLFHSGIYHKAWQFSLNYSKVSDIDYFSDIESTIGSRQDGQLVQEAQLSYRSQNWDLSLLTRDFQILTTSGNQPYQLMPQLAFNYYAPAIMRYLDFDLKSHISRFDTDATTQPSATRVHIEPGFKIPVGATWGNWTTEARLLSTYYQQDLKDTTSDDYEKTVSRTIPEFRSHMGLVLERDSRLLNGYTQTLEPQIQYLYVPKEDQSSIARYDTTLLQTDYYGLFRSRRYSGVDYIAPANQISYGATSRFFDDEYKERLNIAFGQIFYLDKSLKEKYASSEDGDNSNYSAWAVEMDFNYGDYLFYHGGIQYDVDTSNIQVANSTLEYRRPKGFIQTNYRYVAKEYIVDTVGDTLNVDALTKDGISQLGVVTQYSINKNWNTKALYYYDLTTDQSIEWQANLTYISDCWYIGFTYRRELDEWNPGFSQYPDASAVYDNNFSVNVGIVGFGTNMGTRSRYGSDSLGYGRPFFLNN